MHLPYNLGRDKEAKKKCFKTVLLHMWPGERRKGKVEIYIKELAPECSDVVQ